MVSKRRKSNLPFDLQESHQGINDNVNNVKIIRNIDCKTMSDWEDDNQHSATTKHYKQQTLDVEQRSFRGGGGGGDYGRKQSSSRRYDYQNTIDLRMDSVGRIIGRGGSNIQRMETDFNVRVELDKNRGTVTVSGNKDSDVKEAIEQIKNKMSDSDIRGDRNRDRERDRDRDRDSYSTRRNNDYDNSRKNSYYSSGSSRNTGGGRYDNNFDSKSSRSTTVKDDTYDSDSGVNNGSVIDWDMLNQKAEIERKKRWEKCPPLRKDFYNEAPEIADMSPEDAARIRIKNNNTTVSRVFAQENSVDIPNPVTKFEQCFAPYPDLLAEIQKQGFKKPSPIQAQAWPILLKGEDLIGIAQTGTGKTLAFLLPAMIHTEYQSIPRTQRGGPNVLVMAPTRELALQIEKEVNKYSFRNMRA